MKQAIGGAAYARGVSDLVDGSDGVAKLADVASGMGINAGWGAVGVDNGPSNRWDTLFHLSKDGGIPFGAHQKTGAWR